MSHCGISDKGAKPLASALAVSMSLKQLYLTRTNISDTGSAHIANALHVNDPLDSLETRQQMLQCTCKSISMESMQLPYGGSIRRWLKMTSGVGVG